MILISGDSWGKGEWIRYDDHDNLECTEIQHGGLHQYLVESGHECINVSQGGSANLGSVKRLNLFIDKNPAKKISHIIVFQTEYSRDYLYKFEQDWLDVTAADQISSQFIGRFYISLQAVAERAKCRVYVIGGCSDAVCWNDHDQRYPDVEIVCQSMVNLLLNNNHKITEPVLSLYDYRTQELVEQIKQNIDADQVKRLLYFIDMGHKRINLLKDNPEWFYPDGVHPNKMGHKKLFDFLMNKKIFG